jgi:hypothetical protein
VLVDRTSKRRTMAACDLVRGLPLASVPVCAAFHVLTISQLYLVAFVNGWPRCSARPASSSYRQPTHQHAS